MKSLKTLLNLVLIWQFNLTFPIRTINCTKSEDYKEKKKHIMEGSHNLNKQQTGL